MSKFFFKGRQDKRENHESQGYQPKSVQKPGSKKYPLELTVTSEQRKSEIEVILKENALHGSVTVDTNDEAEDNTSILTNLLDKPTSVTIDVVPNRNDPCSCGSGKKYKKCCGI